MSVSEISHFLESRDISAFSKPQYDKIIDCHEVVPTSRNDKKTCHTELFAKKRSISKH
ncbi:hypothetical protein [Helicobacter sp. 23-1046]